MSLKCDCQALNPAARSPRPPPVRRREQRHIQAERAHEGREMGVAVLRAHGDGEDEELALTLVPRAWPGGQGLLGCHIVPLLQ